MTGHVAHAQAAVHAPAADVWRALTDPEQVARWMMGTQLSTTWEPGTSITWQGEVDGKSYEDKGEVLDVERERRLSFTHYSPLLGLPDRPENYHTVTVELSSADGGSTSVNLSQDGNDSPEQAEQFAQNWQSMLDTLKQNVEQ